MKIRCGLIAMLLFGVAFPVASPAKPVKVQKTIPDVFWGRWDFDNTACQGPWDNWSTISATSIDSGEDSSEVISVAVLSDTKIRVTTRDEGELTGDSPPGSDAYIGRSTSTLTLIKHGQAIRLYKTSGKTVYDATAGKCAEDKASTGQ